MGKPKRNTNAALEATADPPSALTSTQSIVKFVKAEGNSVYSCSLPDNKTVLVELPPRYRNVIWMKRGGYLVIDTKDASARENKLHGEIVFVIHNERIWRKMSYWPKEFPKTSLHLADSDDEESTMGMMPPLDSEEE